MAARMMLTAVDRWEISAGLKAGWSIRAIATDLGRALSVISREVRRNSTLTRGYRWSTRTAGRRGGPVGSGARVPGRAGSGRVS